MQRFRGGLVFKAHRLLYHSTLGLRVIKKKCRVYPESHVLRRDDIALRIFFAHLKERLVFKAHRLLYHSTLGLRVIKDDVFAHLEERVGKV